MLMACANAKFQTTVCVLTCATCPLLAEPKLNVVIPPTSFPKSISTLSLYPCRWIGKVIFMNSAEAFGLLERILQPFINQEPINNLNAFGRIVRFEGESIYFIQGSCCSCEASLRATKTNSNKAAMMLSIGFKQWRHYDVLVLPRFWLWCHDWRHQFPTCAFYNI